MKIRVRPIGIIRKYAVEQVLEVPEGLTPDQLIRDLNIPGKLKMVSFVNGVRVQPREQLKDGDEIVLTTLLTGG